MLTISNFSFRYAANKVLKNVNIKFGHGEIVVIAGPNGSGKSTLLKAMLGVVPIHTGGTISGRIDYDGKEIKSYQVVRLAGKIGIVLQEPSTQISNLTVLEEAVFGLFNMREPKNIALAKGKKALKLVGLESKEENSTLSLSGGEMQRLAIASLIAMKPKIMVLDEPLTSLDPQGVQSVIKVLSILKNHVETIIITSHWLDPFLEIATRFVLMTGGSISLDIPNGKLADNIEALTAARVEVPHKISIQHKLKKMGLTQSGIQKVLNTSPLENNGTGTELISCKAVSYRYPDGFWSLSNVNCSLISNSTTALVGPNGSGKSTLANILTGIKKAYSGKIVSKINKPYIVVQKPTLGFIASTVYQEISYGIKTSQREIMQFLEQFELGRYKDQSPFMLSGGEQRRLAIATAFIHKPDFIIFDEPTAGIDAQQIEVFRKETASYGKTMLFITHDSRLFVDSQYLIALQKGHQIFTGKLKYANAQIFKNLGYDNVNYTLAFAMQYMDSGFPFKPEQLEVK